MARPDSSMVKFRPCAPTEAGLFLHSMPARDLVPCKEAQSTSIVHHTFPVNTKQSLRASCQSDTLHLRAWGGYVLSMHAVRISILRLPCSATMCIPGAQKTIPA